MLSGIFNGYKKALIEKERENIIKQGYKKIELDDKLECIIPPAKIKYLNNKEFLKDKKVNGKEYEPELEDKGLEKTTKELMFIDKFFFQNPKTREVILRENKKNGFIKMSYQEYLSRYKNGNFSNIEELYVLF